MTEAMAHVEAGCEARGYSLRERVGGACWQLEQQVCADLLSEWLSLERKRDISFRVLEMEQNHTLDLNGLMLTLRPDRIDEYDDGRRVVIDYKTRAPSKNKWLGHRPEEPQLPLYALLDQAIEGIAFGCLAGRRPREVCCHGRGSGDGQGGSEASGSADDRGRQYVAGAGWAVAHGAAPARRGLSRGGGRRRASAGCLPVL